MGFIFVLNLRSRTGNSSQMIFELAYRFLAYVTYAYANAVTYAYP